MVALGQAAALGIAPSSLLRADAIERALLLEAMPHAAKWQSERDRALARLIIYELAEALKRGRK